jgi:hypothetical protein
MGLMVQSSLVVPARDLGWVLAGVAGVIVAVAPLTVLVWLARPRHPGRPRGFSRRTRSGVAARLSLSRFPLSKSQHDDVSGDRDRRKPRTRSGNDHEGSAGAWHR